MFNIAKMTSQKVYIWGLTPSPPLDKRHTFIFFFMEDLHYSGEFQPYYEHNLLQLVLSKIVLRATFTFVLVLAWKM